MSTKLTQSYISICLNSKIAHLFNDTVTGVQYWRDHRKQKCYKCGKKGHLATHCDKICVYCNNYHPGLPVCLTKIYQYIEKIYKVLNKKINNNLIEKYMILCKKEKQMQDELFEEQIKKYNKIEIKRIEKPKLKIEMTNIINYDFENIPKEEELEEDSSSDDEKKGSTVQKYNNNDDVKRRKRYNKNIFDSDENSEKESSTTDESKITIKEGNNKKFKYIEQVNKEKDKTKIIISKLEQIKKNKKKIQNKTGFQSEWIYKKLKKIGDILRIIKNLREKEENTRGRLDDLYNKIEDKKQNLSRLKIRMNNINEEKNKILNTARIKAENIKHRAYKQFEKFKGKKRGNQPKWIEDAYDKFNKEEEEEYYNRINQLEQNMDRDYKRGLYDMFEDGKMGNYKEDEDFNDFYGNSGI